MYVVKKLNHNAVLIDDNGVEKIAMGKGIGFSALASQPFDGRLADKFFTLDSREKTKRFSELTSQIPLEFIEFSEELIQLISSRISAPLDSNIYIALTDHIYFAIQRKTEDSQVTAIMVSEMKLLYPEEYQVATELVDLINHRYMTELGINEVGFITMHIINAELGERNSLNSLRIIEMTTMILHYLENQYQKSFDHKSLNYHRLMIHIKFLVKRLIYGEKTSAENFEFFNDSFKKSHTFKEASEIKEIIENKFDLSVDDNEVIYLAIHLARIH